MTEVTKNAQLDPDQPGFVAPGDEASVGTLVSQGTTQQDYFGFADQEKWYLPDGVSFMVIQTLNEGMKAQFQKKTQRDVTLERGSGNAKFAMDPAQERWELIKASVVDWNLLRNGIPLPISTNSQNNKRNLADWLELTNPRLVEDLEKFIRKLNPWLQGEMTSADIRKQIDELEELLKETEAREAGEGSSSNR